MNIQAFTLAFALWLEDVKEHNPDLFENVVIKPIEEMAPVMADEFNHFFNLALTQLGEPYADAATSFIDSDRSEDNLTL